MKARKFPLGQLVHVLSRAVEGRSIFSEKDDCYRFIFQMYAANNELPSFTPNRLNVKRLANLILTQENPPKILRQKNKKPRVHILDFSMVVNHYHFCLFSEVEGGITLFMKSLNTAFSKYYNFKHERRGTLFESRYKAVVVKSDFQADAVRRYISLINPLDIFQPGWREKGLFNPEAAFAFLEAYPFSSFPDNLGKRKGLLLAPEKARASYFCPLSIGGKEDYIELVKSFFAERQIGDSRKVFLE